MVLFEWKNWKSGNLPSLDLHSEAKLNVLRNYVEDLGLTVPVCTLNSSFGSENAGRVKGHHTFRKFA